jgi:hypothetical protein
MCREPISLHPGLATGLFKLMSMDRGHMEVDTDLLDIIQMPPPPDTTPNPPQPYVPHPPPHPQHMGVGGWGRV